MKENQICKISGPLTRSIDEIDNLLLPENLIYLSIFLLVLLFL